MKLVNGIEHDEDSGKEEEGEDAKWEGCEDPPAPVGQDEEYVDEDQYATVTVEAVDITRDGFVVQRDSESEKEDDGPGPDEAADSTESPGGKLSGQGKKRAWVKERPTDGKPKMKRKRNFSYENKAERKQSRAKERSKGRAQAAARKSGKSHK